MRLGALVGATAKCLAREANPAVAGANAIALALAGATAGQAFQTAIAAARAQCKPMCARMFRASAEVTRRICRAASARGESRGGVRGVGWTPLPQQIRCALAAAWNCTRLRASGTTRAIGAPGRTLSGRAARPRARVATCVTFCFLDRVVGYNRSGSGLARQSHAAACRRS
eukprot:9502346-Pyramimonas_sp.AAC.1